MEETPLLLENSIDAQDATGSSHPVSNGNGRAAAELCLRRLNPVFVSAAGLVGIDKSAECLTVGTAGPLSPETQAALQFATGLKIVGVSSFKSQIPADEHVLRAAVGKSTAFGHLPPLDPARKRTPGSSLFGLLKERLNGPSHSLAAYEPLARLLDAGYAVGEAAEILLEEHRQKSLLNSSAIAVTNRLSQEQSLANAGKETGAFPAYVQYALSACRDGASQPPIFVHLTRLETKRKQDAVRARFAVAEAVILWSFLALTWGQLFGFAGILILAGGFWLVMRLHNLSAPNRINDLLRTDILTLVSHLDRFDMAPRSAVQVSARRLESLIPTWGRLPDTREGLADALALPRLSRAVLMKGELFDAAQRVAHDCAQQGSAALERLVRISRLASLTGFGIILAMLIS